MTTEIEPPLGASTTDLSRFRTGLSEHRTDLSDVRSHLANERTHLAFLRTGVSLISFGITLNRFSLFLLESKIGGGRGPLHDAENAGLGMVILGCALLIWSVGHFIKISKEIDNVNFRPSKWSLLAFTIAVILFGATTTVLMFVR